MTVTRPSAHPEKIGEREDGAAVELSDQADRDLIVAGIDETVFAAAGAGSGKTRHLIERVCRVLEAGAASVDEIALITFTEAAAAELRDRLSQELERLHERASSESDDTLVARTRDALFGLDAAAVTTLHGFARRILAEHPFEAGVPPTFEVLDEAQSLADLDEHWPAVLEGLLSEAQPARAVQWTLAAGARIGSIQTIARRMGEHWDAFGDEAGPGPADPPRLPDLDPATVLGPLRSALALASRCDDAADNLHQHLVRLGPYAADLADAFERGEELSVLRLLADPPAKLGTNRGRREAWGECKEQVCALLAQAEGARRDVLSDAFGVALRVLGRALGRQVVATARRRRREGRLHFHDLLVLACEVVRRVPEVRGALHRRYRRIFVDEFQDTDPLQAELVTMIAADPDAPVGAVPWWELATAPGALFFVGDPLQSIYAFRRADIATFLRVRELGGPQLASLVTNFRSDPGIVEWLNAVFSEIVGEGREAMQPAYAPQAPRPPAAEARDGPPAVTVLGAAAERFEKAHEAREAEARELASVLRSAVDEGWCVGEGRRPVELSDIVVLVPTRASLPALERAFDEADLAYRLESSSLVYTAGEVQDLLHVLHAIDDPTDEVAIVAALRTPGFGCGDDDLVRWRLARGVWDYTAEAPPGAAEYDPVRRGLAHLRAWHERRAWTGVSELVSAIVDERRQLAAALDGPRWREEWRRLRFVVDQARHFCEGSSGSLGQYLAWVAIQREEDARVTEVVLPETDTPSISVMTVHAAKGLEFPMVAVVGLGREAQTLRAPAVLIDGQGIELSLGGDMCSPGYKAARDRAAARDACEDLRLLYVAVTRARHHLVVSVHRATPRSSTETVAAQLEAALDGAAAWWGPSPSRREVVPEKVLSPPRGATTDAGQGVLPGFEVVTGMDVPTGPETSSGVTVRTPGRPEGAVRPGTGRHTGTVPCGASDGRAHEGSAQELARWAEERARRMDAPASAVAATSVPRLAGQAPPPTAPWPTGPADGPDPVDGLDDGDDHGLSARARLRRGRAGTALGRAVHAVLQMVDLATGQGVDELAAAQASAEGIPALSAEVASLARAALASDVVRTAAASRHWRELYVGVPIEGRVLEGFVDLLFEGPDGLEVVDYKTDRVADLHEIDALAKRYRLQAAAYVHAVTVSVDRPVRQCTLLFLRAGRDGPEAVARSIEDLEGAVADVLSTVAGLDASSS